MDFILNRRSVRAYDLNRKISYSDLKKLCVYGEAAPSARNQRSREYVIIDDQEIINKLSSVSKGSMVLSKCNTVIAVIGKNPNDLLTPHMQIQDLSCSVENILLAATSMGFGSCYIGIYPLEDRINPCNEILNVRDGRFTFALIALGYPLEENCFYEKEKFDEENVHHNGY